MLSEILEVKPETPSVTSFKYTKPANFSYSPGQFTNIELDIADCDERCNKRNFSLVSSPTDDYLMFATRAGASRFKQTTETLTNGNQFHLTGPFGRFILNEDERVGAVMLSGGIGITPLHSMIKYATYKQLPKPITLIYSNSTADDIPFKKDLDEYATQNKHFQAHYTVTNTADTPPSGGWTGRKGRIDETMIQELIPNWQICEFYVCGPAQMVIEIKKLLVNMGLDVEKLKSELFTGY